MALKFHHMITGGADARKLELTLRQIYPGNPGMAASACIAMFVEIMEQLAPEPLSRKQVADAACKMIMTYKRTRITEQ